MNTTESNRLIAEFMGAPIEKDVYSHTNENGVNIHQSYYRYDLEWNWLMRVVEKIESFETVKDVPDFLVRTAFKHCKIASTFKEMPIIDVFKPTKKEAVYSACVQFIQWYNQQQSS